MQTDPGAEAAAAPAATPLPDHYFELYQLAVEMADRISAQSAGSPTASS